MIYWHVDINGVRFGQVRAPDENAARELVLFTFDVKGKRQETVKLTLTGKSYHVGVFGMVLFNGIA